LVSTSLFLMLIAGVWLVSGEGLSGLAGHATALGAYFTNLDRFILPINDYHGFYLSWWFAWSIMIGQFVARFVSGIPVWQLAIALLVVPSIPIALWFTVLYSYFVDRETVGELTTMAMIVVGILFVVNSLDSLTRLYSQNLNLTVERLGRSRYVLAHGSLLIGLVALYQFTPMKIEWVGMVVIGLYAFIYCAVARSRLASAT
jgi:glycine betaine transporter